MPTKGPVQFVTNFNDTTQWEAADGVALSIVNAYEQRPCLHLAGWEPNHRFHFVRTKPIELTPSWNYRLTVTYLVQRIDPSLPVSFDFLYQKKISGIWQGTYIGNKLGANYYQHAGGWQTQEIDFTLPADANGGTIRLLKEILDPVYYIDAYIARVEIVRLLPPTEPQPFDTVPAPLESARSQHPRLFLTAGRVAGLKSQVGVSPYSKMFAKVKSVADVGIDRGPKNDDPANPDVNWQQPYADMIPHLAMTYLISGDANHLQAARNFMAKLCSYSKWLPEDDYGGNLTALALGYDWLWADLDESTRGTIRNSLLSWGRHLYEQAWQEKVWWSSAVLQNHAYSNLGGIGLAGLALFGEFPEVERWITYALARSRELVDALGPDGASQEGQGYWTNIIPFVMLLDLNKSLLDVDLFRGNAWLQNTAHFRLHSTLPRAGWVAGPGATRWQPGPYGQSFLSFADHAVSDWNGPDQMIRKLAAEYRDGHAQWLGHQLADGNVCNDDTASYLNLCWYDPAVVAASPDSLPTFRHFENMGLVLMRSGWSDFNSPDGTDTPTGSPAAETLCAFKCGPFIGHDALTRLGLTGSSGHVHPDAGSFQIHAYGDWLIVDDGFPSVKRTMYQNTLLVNGQGQDGAGSEWFNDEWSTVTEQPYKAGGRGVGLEKRVPGILWADSGADTDVVVGDVTNAYHPRVKLKRFIRHFHFIKPACWVIVDEVEAEQPSTFQFFFHSLFPFLSLGNNTFETAGTKGGLRITFLLPQDVQTEAGTQTFGVHGTGAPNVLNIVKSWNGVPATHATFLTILDAFPVQDGVSPDVRRTMIERKLLPSTNGNDRPWA
jgi:hypothetical protein